MTSAGLEKVKVDEELVLIQAKDDLKIDESVVTLVPSLHLYVVEMIAKFADFATLKTMRCVSKLWRDAAQTEFLRRSVVSLREGQNSKEKLELFKKETEIFKPINKIRIIMTPRPPDESFFNGVTAREADASEAKAFNDILHQVAPDLQILEIACDRYDSLYKSYDEPTMFFPFRKNVKFPSLQKVEYLEFGEVLSSCIEPQVWESIKTLYKNAPNIQELNFQEFYKTFFNVLLNKNGSRNTSLLSKLNSLSVQIDVTKELINYLAKFPQTFQKIDLNCIIQERYANAFEKLLEKNKDSLVDLQLEGFTVFGRRQGIVYFKMPNCFSVLEKLEIKLSGLAFNITFESGALNYCNNFPVLKTLSLCFRQGYKGNGSGLEKIWKTFFPKQICTSVTLLELDLRTLYSDFLQGQGVSNNWHKEMFPNSQFKYL